MSGPTGSAASTSPTTMASGRPAASSTSAITAAPRTSASPTSTTNRTPPSPVRSRIGGGTAGSPYGGCGCSPEVQDMLRTYPARRLGNRPGRTPRALLDEGAAALEWEGERPDDPRRPGHLRDGAARHPVARPGRPGGVDRKSVV